MPPPPIPDIDIEQLYKVYGPPGCGKTTFVKAQVQAETKRGKRGLLTSLTKAAAAELAGRNLPIAQDAIGTLHSHAYKAMGHPKVATGKALQDWNETHRRYALTGSDEDMDAAVEGRFAGDTDGDVLMSQMQVLRARMVPVEEWPATVRAFRKAWDEWKKDNELVDFTDMIEFCVEYVDVASGRPDYLVADEAQDMDRLQMTLIRKWGAKCERVFIVGDPDQNLYQWRGSDPEAFLLPPVAADHRRVLSQSYRVPRAVHAWAVKWIERTPGREPVEYRPRKAEDGSVVEGRVRKFNVGSWKDPARFVDDAEKQVAGGRTVMFLASCAYLLNPLITKLRERGLPFFNPYRAKDARWNPLRYGGQRVRSFLKMSDEHFGDAAELWTGKDVRRWAETLVAKDVFERGGKNRVITQKPDEVFDLALMGCFTDEAQTRLAAFDLDWWKSRAMKQYENQLAYPIEVVRRRSARALVDEPKIIVGTIHSVKGGEADVVYVFPDLSMQGHLDYQNRGAGQTGFPATLRQFYVAYTRAREELVLLPPATRQSI